ncbi:MAG: 4Fe-4S dicluster domain-containing protein [Acidobacteriota bacterium]
MRYAFVIDQSRCIGCHACSVACKAEHEVPLGSYRTWVKYVEKGSFPHVRRTFSVLRCNHCEDAPCVEICPVTALYRRADGIVDFDRNVCIGCKACLQACPYDALYIHPDNGTAEKCNFCAHRVEIGLEPPCATVCPTESILVGDLDDPGSRVAQLVASRKVAVRKPEKGTRPKVFYIEGEPQALRPGAADPSGGYLWAEGPQRRSPTLVAGTRPESVPPPADAQALAAAAVRGEADFFSGAWAGLSPARTVYDVAHAEHPWGWKVSAYLWTKSVSAGAFMVAALAPWLGLAGSDAIRLGAPLIGLFFLALTGLLLVTDLKRPERFLSILTRPNWSSWLARGAFILAAYGLLGSAWSGLVVSQIWGGGAAGEELLRWLRWPLVAAALAAAGYSGYLFAQAKGRDFWQSPLLPLHLAVQAVAAGAASTALLASLVEGLGGTSTIAASGRLGPLLAAALSAHLALVAFGEVTIAHATDDGARAAHAMTRGAIAGWFWSGMTLAAMALIVVAVAGLAPGWIGAIVALAALASLATYEHAWNLAGQAVPLS